MDILIRDAMIVTLDPLNEVIERGYVLIKGDAISRVSAGAYDGCLDGLRIIDGKDYCVMPGLVNCHTHMAMTLLRGYGEGLPLMRWLNEKVWPMEAKFRGEHIAAGSNLAMVEMLRSGTTTFSDMYFYQDEVKRCAEEYGMRAVLGYPIMGDAWESLLNSYLGSVEGINSEKSGMSRAMLAPHSPYTLSEDALKAIAAAAKDLGCGIHIHVSETEDEQRIVRSKYGKTPSELLLEAGIFDVKTMAAHCVYLTEGDMEIMKSRDVSPVHNPVSNMKLASGAARVEEMLDRGIRVCLGTDGASSNNCLNMFGEMKAGALLQKLTCRDTTVLSGRAMLEIAAANGAAALGFGNLGRIRQGHLADLIMVSMKKPSMVPVHDIHSNLVFSANGSEVEYVIINGKLIMEKGEFRSIDEERVIYEAARIAADLS
ncbi:MAG: trzA [Firmicutes bacterium]|nr:trzA [Bacillota bacterium]